jgi:hypothetical protein
VVPLPASPRRAITIVVVLVFATLLTTARQARLSQDALIIHARGAAVLIVPAPAYSLVARVSARSRK